MQMLPMAGMMHKPPGSWRPGFTMVRAGVVAQWELMFQDETTKDVEIVCADGKMVLADSLLLQVASPVFRSLLDQQREEEAPAAATADAGSSGPAAEGVVGAQTPPPPQRGLSEASSHRGGGPLSQIAAAVDEVSARGSGGGDGQACDGEATGNQPEEEEEAPQTLGSTSVAASPRRSVPESPPVSSRPTPTKKAVTEAVSCGCRRLRLGVPGFSSVEFRFFLRLLYTGKMEPSDWPTEEVPTEYEQLPTLPGSLVCQPPATTEPVLPFDGRHSFSAAPVPVPVPTPGLRPGAIFDSKVVSPRATPSTSYIRSPPAKLLMAAAAISKKYQVQWLLHILVDVIRQRITEVSFDSILGAAVFHDIAPVRLAALEFAQKSATVWRHYVAGDYAPEVLFELKAVFCLFPRDATVAASTTMVL